MKKRVKGKRVVRRVKTKKPRKHPKSVKKIKHVKVTKRAKKAEKHSKSLAKTKHQKKIKTKHGYEPEFIKTNIPGFDSLVKGGIPKGSSLLVQGGPGSGKTILCLTLLKNFCKEGKKVLYMSFEEPEGKLKSHMEGFGVDVDKYEKEKLLYVKRFNALDIARSVEALLSEAKKELLIDVQPVLIPKEFQPDIVLIDSLTSISSAFSGADSRFRIYMEQLFRYLESHKMTSFLIREVASPTNIGRDYTEMGEAVSFLSDGIIVLYNVFYQKHGYRKRALEIIKMRGTQIDRRIVECEIYKNKGIVVQNKKNLKGDYVLT